jgi:hypothetical protein
MLISPKGKTTKKGPGSRLAFIARLEECRWRGMSLVFVQVAPGQAAALTFK